MRIKVSEKEVLNPGYRRVYVPPSPIQEEALKSGESKLRDLKKGQRVKPRQVRAQHQSLNEAGLIALMHAREIGRPATYAVILESLLKRKYVQKERGKLVFTTRGREVLDFLLNEYPELFSLDFSARMEAQLDDIATKKKSYGAVVNNLWKNL